MLLAKKLGDVALARGCHAGEELALLEREVPLDLLPQVAVEIGDRTCELGVGRATARRTHERLLCAPEQVEIRAVLVAKRPARLTKCLHRAIISVLRYRFT